MSFPQQIQLLDLDLVFADALWIGHGLHLVILFKVGVRDGVAVYSAATPAGAPL